MNTPALAFLISCTVVLLIIGLIQEYRFWKFERKQTRVFNKFHAEMLRAQKSSGRHVVQPARQPGGTMRFSELQNLPPQKIQH